MKKSHESPRQSNQASQSSSRQEDHSLSSAAVQSSAVQQPPLLSSPLPSQDHCPRGPRRENEGHSLKMGFLHPQPSPIPSKAQSVLRRLSPRPGPRPRAPQAAPHSRVDDGHEMHQPQHHEEDEPKDGHSLQGQVQQRHPPARPGPLRLPPRTALPLEGGRPASGRRRGEEGGERKGRTGVGAEGAGRPARPARALPWRARGCRRAGGRAPWSG